MYIPHFQPERGPPGRSNRFTIVISTAPTLSISVPCSARVYKSVPLLMVVYESVTTSKDCVDLAVPCRFPLDALQLAIALDLQVRGLVTDFVCSDRGLLSVAAAEGLSVLNPENP